MSKIGILGGGLTALTIASELQKPHEILEKNKECGGLCRSLHEHGFTFDRFGGHIFYSKDKPTMDWMLEQLGDNKAQQKRNNKVLVKGRYIKYPFENDLFHLPPIDNIYCLLTYIFNPRSAAVPQNFREWIINTFGDGIAKLYMLPYNEKIWKFPLDEMSTHWVYGRVPKPPKVDVVKSSFGISTEGYTHQLYFNYPKHGGIQSLIDSLEKKAIRREPASITNHFEVRSIKKSMVGRGKIKKAVWKVSNGEHVRQYSRLISTIPLNELVRMLPDVPQRVKTAAKSLRYNSLATVLIGIDAKNPNDFTAIYAPGKEIEANRICFMNNFSEFTAPHGKAGIMAEITMPPERFDTLDEKRLARRIIDSLHSMRIINKQDVIYTSVQKEKYAYIVYDLEYQKNIKIVRDYVEEQGILLCGRFAEFEYLNMDSCVKRARELAERLNADE